jgi:hypothetical protein
MAPVDASAVAAAIVPYVGRVIFARGYGKADWRAELP